MNAFMNGIRVSLAACIASLWCASPLWADDIEIFFGDVTGTDIRPNVLFIIDTSGSMDAPVDGTGKDRLDNVKDAMYQLLEELNNVNVGLMRFTNPGGPVLYPISFIDEDVNADKTITVESSVSSSSDDAQELESTGLVTLDSQELQLVELTVGGLGNDEDSISANIDDVEETLSSGSINRGSGDLDFDASRRIGLRFTGSSVPDNATITSAFVRFTGAGGGNSNNLRMRVFSERDDTGEFPSNDPYNVRDRADRSVFVDWLITSAVVQDQTVDSPELKTLVQNIVDDSSWNPAGGGEDDIVLIFEPHPDGAGSGDRNFYTRDGSSSRDAQLFVEYYVGASPAAGLSRVGLRFSDLDVPKGATIAQANIVFTASRDFRSDYSLSITAENTANPTTFSATTANISAGRGVTGNVPWAGTLEASTGDTFLTPDISSLVSAVTSSDGWCGGNNLSLIVTGTSGKLPVASFDASASLAPRLVVTYEYGSIVPGASCIQRSISRTVGASSDDAEEVGTTVSTTSGDHDLYEGSVSGIRFRDITVPKNAAIAEAYIELTAENDDSGTTIMDIYAESSVNALPYASNNGSIEGRGYFADKVRWTESTSWTTNRVYRSPNIADLVEAVVAQTDWESGNAMAFQIDTETSTDREAETYDGSPGEAPRLIIEFEDDGTGLETRRVRDVIADEVSQLNHNGWTPIQDTLYEAALYYSGDPVKWGKTRGSSSVDGGPFSYARVSAAEAMVPDTYTINRPSGCSANNLNDSDCENENISGSGAAGAAAPMYKSPIDNICQEESHIILLTDGFANRPHSAGLIDSFMGPGRACLNEPTLNLDGTTTALSGGEQCVKDLVSYMNQEDIGPPRGVQRIRTHTIGFNFSSQWLADVAEAGDGLYKTANNATQLVDEIKAIIGEVLKTDTTFVAPVAAVNEFNQLSHLSQVYFAVFRPDEFPRWRGNLKKYSLSEDGKADIVDVQKRLAVDAGTGFFLEGSQSYWSPERDGAKVDFGGAASKMPEPALRNVFTYHSASTTRVLSDSDNVITPTNTLLTKAMFDVTTLSDTEFQTHLKWVRGFDVDDENGNQNTEELRYTLGDPLHSRPVAVTYDDSDTDDPDVEIFFGTNNGGLHAVNARNGVERFTFIPAALLPLQATLRVNDATTAHPYGMDGTITRWSNDNGRDGISTSDSEDFVRIYSGMRRGGRNYYALEVTDRANPELMWSIEGGAVQANGDDFSELGQSWSRPIKTQIVLQGDSSPREVLIFSGGYDEDQDDARTRTPDDVGRAMYIVDALSGAIIWSGGKTGLANIDVGFTDMNYSFPSTMSVVDINQDGLADMWFAGDTGGQMWRFDIKNGESLANLIDGGVIADLGVATGTNVEADNRRFFSSPSVALVRGPAGPELAVALGSGFRPSPLGQLASNRMFMLRQRSVFAAPASYTKLTTADLYDATDTPDAADKELLFGKEGWFFDLPLTDEKVLSSPLIVNERIVFTTYTPGAIATACRPAAGTSRAYAVGLEDAVRDDPEPLLTPSIVDQATVILPPPAKPDEGDNGGGNGGDDGDDGGAGGLCPNGNSIEIKLNAEDGPIDEWCNDSSKTYWMKER